jgi:hypothetical protein
MAKAFFLLLLSIGIIGLASTDKPNRLPFQIRVVDERTGIGVGNLRVVTDNGIACYTRANGDVFGANLHSWTEMFVSRLRTPQDSLTPPLQVSESHMADRWNLNFTDAKLAFSRSFLNPRSEVSGSTAQHRRRPGTQI